MATNKHCYGCCKNDAVMDLVFGELAEQVRVPWCAHCIAPDTWNASPFHRAETYGAEAWGKVLPQEKKRSALDEMSEAVQKVIDGISAAIKENFIPKMPSPKVGVFDTTHLVPTKEQLEREAAKLAELKKEIDAPLYSRQPHYEGGIDPITFGQDNLSNLEMNGFYKMNVIKYVARCDRKNGLEDLKKARDYLNLLIDSYEDCDPEAEIYFGKKSGRKPACFKHEWKTEDEERAYKEAELCYQKVMSGKTAIIKRADVLEELQCMLTEVNYSISSCGDGTTYVELQES